MDIATLDCPQTGNLCDVIQALAARQLVGPAAPVFDRDNLAPMRDVGQIGLFCNGWVDSRLMQHFPPPSNVYPMYVSVHVTPQTIAEHRAHFLAHQPIGCRDEVTADRFRSVGVKAVVTGCITLSLLRPYVEKTAHVAYCDVSKHYRRQIARSHPGKARIVTHRCATRRFETASGLLDLYASAGHVVTSRPHAALACLAFNTPITFVPQRTAPHLFEIQELIRDASLADDHELNTASNSAKITRLRQTQRQLIQDKLSTCGNRLNWLSEPEFVYGVIGTARSGSTYLCSLLSSTGVVGAPDEYADHNVESRLRHDWGIPNYFTKGGFLATAIARTATNGVAGSKFCHPHEFREMARFPISKWIWIRRGDAISQAISLYRARKSQQWTLADGDTPAKPPPYSVSAISRALQDIQIQNGQISDGLQDQRHLEVWYEDLERNPNTVVETCQRFLGVQNASCLPVALKVQRDSTSQVWKRRFSDGQH